MQNTNPINNHKPHTNSRYTSKFLVLLLNSVTVRMNELLYMQDNRHCT